VLATRSSDGLDLVLTFDDDKDGSIAIKAYYASPWDNQLGNGAITYRKHWTSR
jgi:hypothetical protein